MRLFTTCIIYYIIIFFLKKGNTLNVHKHGVGKAEFGSSKLTESYTWKASHGKACS